MQQLAGVKLTDEQRQLVVDNQKLVYSEFSKFGKTFLVHFWKEDILQEGFYGLCCAAATFDVSRGVTFSSYAVPAVRNAMLMMLRWLRGKKIYKSELRRFTVQSLEELLSDDGEGNLSIQDTLKDETFDWVDVERRLDMDSFLSLIPMYLTDKQFKVLNFHFQGLTYQEIGEELGSSRQAVGICMNRIRKKIKKLYNEMLGKKGYEPIL